MQSIKIKSKSLAIVCSFMLLTLFSCDYDHIRVDKEITSLEYAIPAYSEIKISNAFDAYITFSDTEESIIIEANDNLHDRILVQREDNALTIKLKNFTSVKGNATLKAYITTNNIHKFEAKGASNITFENEWIVNDGRIELTGASELYGEVNANHLRFDLRGASELDLFGSATILDANLSGSSDFRDYDLTVARLDIDMTGASEAAMSVTESIDIEARGASVLSFKGDAVITRKELSGASELKNRN